MQVLKVPPRQARTLLQSESILAAPFGVVSLMSTAARALTAQGDSSGSLGAQAATAPDSPFVMVEASHLATMEWIPIPDDPNVDPLPLSSPLCAAFGPRQGSLVQDRLSGCGVPFAIHDLPGRYGGGEW